MAARPALALLAAGLGLAGCLELPAELPPYPAADAAGIDAARDGAPPSPDAAPPADAARPDAAPSDRGPGPDAAAEVCNGLDDDGDGAIDEALTPPPWGRPAPDAPDACRPRVALCRGGEWVDVADRYAPDERQCDGLDNDCDGAIDEGTGGRCTWCDGAMTDPPCNGCPDRTVVPPGFVCVPPGRFEMGSPPNQPDRQVDEGPIRVVEISRPFLLSIGELTLATWLEAVVDLDDPNPSYFAADGRRCAADDPLACPIERVSWYDAVRFADALSDVHGLITCYVFEDCRGQAYGGCPPDAPQCFGAFECEGVERVADCDGYRLPTEAEWAHAARAGTNTRFWSGDAAFELASSDWFAGNADDRPRGVDPARPANRFGLVDVHGNVAEWVFDAYAPYPDPPPPVSIDPVTLAGDRRVVRGGAWDASAAECRSAARDAVAPTDRSASRGVRLARDVAPAPYDVADRSVDP